MGKGRQAGNDLGGRESHPDLFKGIFIHGGKNRYRQGERPFLRDGCKHFVQGGGGRRHHLTTTQRMEGKHGDAQFACLQAGFGNGIGNVVIFEIEKNPAAVIPDHPHCIRAAAGEKLFPHLENPDPVTKALHPAFCFR